MLYVLGQTLNVMTLGGLALAVGILVDDATVEIENNHRHLDMGKPIRHAILDGAAEVATPAIVATLSICIVFVPIFLLTGVGGFLFAPLAMSVVFAMLASYLLSRTLVPTMFWYLMPAEVRARRRAGERPGRADRCSAGSRVASRPRFLRFADAYEGALDWVLEHRKWAMVGVPRVRDRCRWRCSRSSAATSSRPSTRDSSGCTCGARRARGSSRRRSISSRSRTTSVR